MATDLDTTVRQLLSCLCDALTEADRPTCACYATVGPPVVGLCCDCDTPDDDYYGTATISGEATAHVEQIYDAAPDTLAQVSPVHPCRRGTTAADITLVVTRCYPTIGEDGNMPPTDDQDLAALELHTDIDTIWKALTCGCFDGRLTIRNVSSDAIPEGGCSVIAARVTVEVRI